MNRSTRNDTKIFTPVILFLLIGWSFLQPSVVRGQDELSTRRGKLWELIRNDGWLGSLGAWDFLSSEPLGMYPGFAGYMHPVGGEGDATDTYANANFHNFRSGCWVVAKGLQTPGMPPANNPTLTLYEGYLSGLQGDTYGIENTRKPIVLKDNFSENPGYDPALPEEMLSATWNTNLGVTITRRSYVWSFPGYRDFIIYDYLLVNTGLMVSNYTGTVVPNFPKQTLKKLYFVNHSGISVSTKSQINFHSQLEAVQAGAFGWKPGSYHDYYYHTDNNTLMFSRNINGGMEPRPGDPYPVKDNKAWQAKFGKELEDPAAFGWLSLYASPTGSAPRTNAAPDVYRIDVHKGGTLKGTSLDLEHFSMGTWTQAGFYDFATTPDTQKTLGNKGNRMNFYSFSYGPYTMQPNDTIRVIVAEIAGTEEYTKILAGDTTGLADSTVAAIRRNAQNARNAVQWGMGASVNDMKLAAAVPPPPPAPHTDAVNASVGINIPAIGVTWDKVAETAIFNDGSGSVFYNGIEDLDGYRIYRSRVEDLQYVNDNDPKVLRGAAWSLVVDIPKSRFLEYFKESIGKYQFIDSSVAFDHRYGYYASAYRSHPRDWTSPNKTKVLGASLGELASGDVNHSALTPALAGPVNSFDIFVAPNPYIFNDPQRSLGIADYNVAFHNLPVRCDIRIYTISGIMVRLLNHTPDARGNVSGTEIWDQKTSSGLLVAPGLYIYNVQSTTPGLEGKFTGRMMLVR